MRIVRVYPAVAQQAQQMQAPPSRVFAGGPQNRIFRESVVANHPIQPCNVHLNNAAGADIQVADFAVTHLAIGQADRFARGMNQSVRVVAQEAVEHRGVRRAHRVALDGEGVPPSVENGQDHRLLRHYRLNAFRPA